jgi:hypothetical protein
MSGMHLVRGMTSLNTRKRKARKKTAAILEEEKKMAALLQRVGYQKGSTYRTSIPDYTVSQSNIPTSDMVGNGFKRVAKQYTGDELAGIGTLHKSNMVPIRKDSNAAKEIATMRRN